jgi:hypothetical protein
VARHPLPGWAAQAQTHTGGLATTVTQHWREISLAHIFGEKHMGGHKVATVLVRGGPAMLFEYRSGIPDRFDYAFWQQDRWGYGDFS